MTNYVIIGSSAAGISCASKIKDLDPTSNVLCISNETEMPYNRCLIADMLGGIKTEQEVSTKPQSFFDEKGITLRLNTHVISIDNAHKVVITTTGERIPYDKLFIGTGRSSWIPTLPGSTAAGVLAFYGLRDTKNILDYLAANTVKHAVVVGGGFSGVECADGLSKRGVAVTLIERSPHIFAHQSNADGAQTLTGIMNKHNVDVISNDEIITIQNENNVVTGVTLKSGTTLATDLVVFAIGGKTNSDITDSCNLTMHGRCIVVDEHMRTSDADIFAGGDVTAVPSILDRQLIQTCKWSDAVMQGMIAGQNMVGQTPRSYGGILAITSTHVFGTTFVTCGPVVHPPTEYTQLEKRGEDFYHLFLVQDKKLKGFALVGNVTNVGVLRKAITEQTSLDL
jgi:nitrite reductase (NADH) large subunit